MSNETAITAGELFGIADGGGLPADNNEDTEVVFNATFIKPVTDEDSISDGGDHAPSMKLEVGDGNVCDNKDVETENTPNNQRQPKRSNSPPAKSSKRKRKNRRRREKKAAAGSGGLPAHLLEDSDLANTGTETSVNSEDVSKADDDASDEIGTDMEMEQETQSTTCVELPIITIAESPEENAPQVEENDPPANTSSFLNISGPTVSVETLLHIAKQKIVNKVFGTIPAYDENFNVKEGSLGTYTTQSPRQAPIMASATIPTTTNIVTLSNVLPQGPSSSEYIIGCEDLDENKDADQQKAATVKAVHFDEKPPVVHSATSLSEGLAARVVEILDLQPEPSTPMVDQEQVDDHKCEAKKKSSTETIILINKVGPVDSTTSSVASTDSVRSLLKGTGSSCEDVADDSSSVHYPSREIVEDGNAGNEGSTMNLESFRESIEVFKTQNPEQTQCLQDDVDQILNKSLEKFNTAMEICTAQCGGEPTFLSYQTIPTGDIIKEGENNATFTKENESIVDAPNMEMKQLEEDINTTFVVENEEQIIGTEESPILTETGSPELEVEPELPSTQPDLSVVLEIDEEMDTTLTTNQCETSSSETSTVVEAISVQYIPSLEIPTLANTESVEAVLCNENDGQFQTTSEIEGEQGMEFEKAEASLSESGPEHYLSDTCNVEHDDVGLPELHSDLSSEGMLAEAEASKSVEELLTLHFPAPNLTQDINKNTEGKATTSAAASKDTSSVEHDLGIDIDGAKEEIVDCRGDRQYFNDTETESDCPWTPERVESLTKIIAEKEKLEAAGGSNQCTGGQQEVGAGVANGMKNGRNGSLKKSKQTGSSDDLLEEPGSGCSCAKMCVIM